MRPLHQRIVTDRRSFGGVAPQGRELGKGASIEPESEFHRPPNEETKTPPK